MKERTEKRIYDEKFIELLKENHGTRCINCGSDLDVEYHHIVPLVMGGTNAISNFAPLCYVCHKKSHGYKTHLERKRKRLTGRPIKMIDSHDEIFERYKNGEIGSSEAKALLGISQKSHFTEHVLYKEYLNKNGIKYIRNNIDIIVKKSGDIEPGRVIGHIEFVNGDIFEIRYKEKETTYDDEVHEDETNLNLIVQFAYGQIGERELKERMNLEIENVYESNPVLKWCKFMGVEKLRNYVDAISMCGDTSKYPGRTISEICYKNGKVERVSFDWKLDREINTYMPIGVNNYKV